MRILLHLLPVGILLFTSCEGILNGRTTNIRIITDEATLVVINGDSTRANNWADFSVPRSKDPLVFKTVIADSAYTHRFEAINSLAYYSNILPFSSGIGFLLDARSQKRYTYPRKIWIKNNKALTYTHKNPHFKFDNMIKATFNNVLDFNDFIEHAVYYERRLNSFSSSTIGIGIPLNSLGRTQHLRGYRLGYEHKFFFRRSAPFGQYIGLEFNHFSARYLSDIRFVNKDIIRESDPLGLGDFLGVLFDADHRTYRELVRMDKKTYTFNVKYGIQQRINRVIFDFSIGLGMKKREVKHIGRFRPQDEIHRSWLDLFNNRNENKVGNSWSLTFPLNLKIGYSF